MEDRRVIGIGNLKERIERVISKFDCVYKYESYLEDNPMRVEAYIDPKLTEYNEIKRFINFMGSDEDRVSCTLISTDRIIPLRRGFNSGEAFSYLIGLDEIKKILAISYDLPEGSYVEDINKIHDEIHIIIKDKKREPVFS